MKKKFYQISLIITLIFINSCTGYTPIFSKANLKFDIANYSIEGDKFLGNKIYSKLNILSSSRNQENARSIDIRIKTTKNKKPTSKNSAGKILEYKIVLNIEVKVNDYLTNEKIFSKIFTSSTSYKVQNQYSDSLKLENESTENLVNKTYEEIIIELSQKI